jgi:NADP-dependent aldehyde dehydrogenase
MTDIVSINPRTATVTEVVAVESSPAEVETACASAAAATPRLDALGRAGRAAMLRAMADALESRGEDVVGLADRETGIGTARLGGELKRTSFQLRVFAGLLRPAG